MNRFSFALHVTGPDLGSDRYEDAFYMAGCEDALIVVANGAMHLDFDREASSFEAAVQSATRDVERAGAHVHRVEPIDPI
jgi:hypothetical protein